MAEIRLRIVVDGKEAIPEAMKQASAAVAQSSQQIALQLSDAGKRGAQALNTTLPPAARQAANQIQAALSNIKGIDPAMLKELMAGMSEGMEAELRQSAQSFKTFEQESGKSINQARSAAQGLAGMLGVTLPANVNRFLSESRRIGPALSSAFNVIAVIGVLQVLSQIPATIERGIQWLQKWGDAAKEAYGKAIRAGLELEDENRRIQASLNELATIGLQGVAKLAAEQKVLEQNTALSARANHDLTMEAGRLTQQIKDLDHWYRSNFAFEYWNGNLKAIDQYKMRLEALNAQIESTRADRNKVFTEGPRIQKEIDTTGAQVARSEAEAVLNAKRKVAEAELSMQEASIRSARALGAISAAEETAALKEAEEKKLQIFQEFAAARRAQLEDERASTGRPIKADLTGLDSDEAAAKLATKQKIEALDVKLLADEKRRQEEATRQKIEQERVYAETSASIQEQNIRAAAAARQFGIEDEKQALLNIERDRLTTQQNAVQAEIALHRQSGQDRVNEIQALEAQLEQNKVEHVGRVHAIENDANNRTLEERRRLDEQLRASAEKAADFELKQAQSGLGGDAGIKQQEAALADWYAKKITLLNQSLEAARTTYGHEHAEYQRVVEQMNELDRERLEKQQAIDEQSLKVWQNRLSTIDRTFNENLLGWIKGQQTFSQAMIETWNQIAANAIRNLIQMAQQALISAIIQKNIAKGEIFAEAKLAAAKAWRSAMSSGIPFPFNVAAGAAAAGAVFAGVVALNSFDGGGIVPATDIAMLHKNEMVLPANISQGLQSWMKGGAGSSTPTVNLGGIHFHGPVDKKIVDYAERNIAAAVRNAIRSGHLKLEDLTS